ncbi:ATP-binding protein [Bdellovibrio reynosensis]|uniref:histidine kinase n=1 Tax=Bdellovibrio reynosensis TaxID=2835041 RepID=A0ABY4C909_9BACT|nr:ATP-binding protein [Bdellovibrio reynosensis]UOF01264.1 ATP-binding protein [Bdellovibrio reynosensis]
MDFKTLFEQAPDLYCVLLPDFTVIAVSDAYNRATKTRREEMIGKTMFEVFPDNPDDPNATGVTNLRHSLETALRTKQPDSMAVQKYDIRRPQEEGGGFEERYWSPVNTPILNEQGEVIYLLHKAQDVTDFINLKKQEQWRTQESEQWRSRAIQVESDIYERAQEIQKANKELAAKERELRKLYEKLTELDRQKTQFFANVSHELRTPLTLIIGPVDQLLKSPEITAKTKELLELIRKNAMALLRQVNDLLDIAKFDAGELAAHYEQIQLNEFVKRIADNFSVLAQEKNIQFTLDLPEELKVEVDPDKLQKIVMNLLGNAFKFTPANGKIRISLENKVKEGRPYFVLSVADSGPGIPENQRKNIFERFFQIEDSKVRQKGGTGLGLSIVKDFTDLLQGKVEVSQAQEGGAQFIIEIPMIAPEKTEVFTSIHEGSQELTQQQMISELIEEKSETTPEFYKDEESDQAVILVVEDNSALRNFVASCLSAEFRCVTAGDGLEGYRQAQLIKPDLILTDLMMPKYDGTYLIDHLRLDQEIKDIPVIVLTARADDKLRMDLLSRGAADYLLKPFPPEELLVRVRNHVSYYRAKRLLQTELEMQGEDLDEMVRELASANQELKRLSKMKDEFLATLSHELRTPASIIFSYSEMLKEEELESEFMIEAIEAVNRNAKMQLRLVSDLLDIARSMKGKISLAREKILFEDVLQEVLQSQNYFAKEKGVELKFKTGPALPPIWADPVRLSQILGNLISNAIKFTHPGGHILIEAVQNKGFINVSVIDDGEGITPDYLPHIFKPFTQQNSTLARSHTGLGLGLSIVQHLVQLHGGTISAHSEGLNRGSKFLLSLPVFDEKLISNFDSIQRQDGDLHH